MTAYRKKLIEVALPLEAINVASAREKSIRHGHPSTLHLWWARRPLAACRAVLFASLVDDPDSDPAFAEYDAETRERMTGEKRQQLFDLITELVQWENSNNELVLSAARAEIARCVASRKIELGELKKDHKLVGGETVYDIVVKGHGDLVKLREGKTRLPNPDAVKAFLAEYAPPVLDPFAGGGSIPLEAQRLGLRAYASDLNPVPVLINKAVIDIPYRFKDKPPVNPDSRGEAGPAGKKGHGKGRSVTGQSEWHGINGLAADVRYYAKWLRDEAEKRIGQLYPKIKVTAEMAKERPDIKHYVGEELPVIAWLWARTVASPNPSVGGAHIPLARSFWLSTKKGKEAWVRPVARARENAYEFTVGVGEPPAEFDPSLGTVGRTGGTCLLTGQPIPLPFIRAEGKAGRMSQRLMAIVAEGPRGRVYLPPVQIHEAAAKVDRPVGVAETDIPDEALGFRIQLYGLNKHYSLFTNRQLTTLAMFADLIANARAAVVADASANPAFSADDQPLEEGGRGAVAYGDAIALYLSLCLGKLADLANALCAWEPIAQCPRHLFGKQTISMVWDFAEGNPLGSSSGSWSILTENNQRAFESPFLTHDRPQCGTAVQLDATACSSLGGGMLISTDPPYYDNIGYADLSDFFYIWSRRAIQSSFPMLCSTLLTPKSKELIAAPYRHGGSRDLARKFFEEGLGEVFVEARSMQAPDYPISVFYAFKQSEADEDEEGGSHKSVASTGWETILEGCINAQLTIEGTWPMRTEMGSRLRGMDSNALATSIVLICRPRPVGAPLATRREFINALKHELPNRLKHLQRGSIAPVDLAQATIGPGMAVFTRYARVIEADGSPMRVRQALALINQTLDEVLSEQEGEFDGDTRWAVAWFEQFGMEEGAFGVAETLSKAKNTGVNGLVDAGIIAARSGKVRLLKREELPDDWNPQVDDRVRHWEVAQHLIRALETGGEIAASNLLRKVGGMGEVARDLAYRLYNLCERKKWASEALSYNGLVIAWPEITKLSQSSVSVTAEPEARLF